MACIDVRVALRCGEARVTQKFLNSTEIGTPLEQMGGEAVAKGVRTDLLCQCGLVHPSRQDGAHTSICQSPPPSVDEQRFALRPCSQPRREIGAKRRLGSCPEWNDALFSTLSEDPKQPPVEIDVPKIEANQFPAADSSAIEQFEDRTGAQDRVAFPRHVEQRGHLRFIEMDGNAFFRSG
jgi:hypothetical protein